jgi:hypothetical protein
MDFRKDTSYNTPMSFTRTRRLIGLLILLLSLAILCWGLWPSGKLTQTVPLAPSDMQLPAPDSFLPEWGSREAMVFFTSEFAETTEIHQTTWMRI